MNKKNKTENSYVNMFKHKLEPINKPITNPNEKLEMKKALNFDEIEDWTTNLQANNSNNEIERNSYIINHNNELDSNKNRQNKVQEIVQNFGKNYHKLNSETNNLNSNNIAFNDDLEYRMKNYDTRGVESKFINSNNTNNPANVQFNGTSNNYENMNNDDYSVNTSYFTNRFGEMNNQVDKIELSQINDNLVKTNMPNKKMANFVVNSTDNFPNYYAASPKNYEVIEEKEEEYMKLEPSHDFKLLKKDKTSLSPKKYKMEEFGMLEDDSLDDDNFSLDLKDASNVTENQLEDMNKELKDINRQLKNKEKQEETAAKKNELSKSIKKIPEPLINNKIANEQKENKPKRKYSPYLRNTNVKEKDANKQNHNQPKNQQMYPEDNVNLNNNYSKPISIGTYQQNMNIVHFQQPNMSNIPMPMYYNGPYPGQMPMMNMNMNPSVMPPEYQYNYNNGMYPNSNQNQNPNQPYNMITNDMAHQNYYSHNTGVNANNVQVNMNIKSSPKKTNQKTTKNIIPQRNNTNSEESEDEPKDPSLNKGKYKPHTLKEYRKKYNQLVGEKKEPQSLGANIGTKEWKEKEEKKIRAKEYSENIKSINKFQKKDKPQGEYNSTFNENLDDDSLFDKQIEKDIKKSNNRQLNTKTPESASNRTGYSHIHNLRKLKDETKNVTKQEQVNNKKVDRPMSISKYSTYTNDKKTNDKAKIYTTLNNNTGTKEKSNVINNISKNSINTNLNISNATSNLSKLDISKVRPASSRPKIKNTNENNKITSIKSNDLDELINNHNFYHDKVEKIRNFINKC